ncbi:MAG: Rieske 2Fe-2S domain-containing protein [Candidatus Dormibacteria bacterium]
MGEPLVDRFIRRQRWLEPLGSWTQAAVKGSYRALGPVGPGIRDLLHGSRGLGHPLHPALTDVPLGAWTAGLVLDYVAHFTPRLGTAAGDVALAVGLATSLPAIASGLTDSEDTYGQERRINILHGLTMTSAFGLLAASLGLRWWSGMDLHPLAVGLSTAGVGVAMGGMYLGGHLTFGVGTMVNRNAFLEGPTKFQPLGKVTDFEDGRLTPVDLKGMPVVVLRRGDHLCALGGVCSHAGGPLAEGDLDGAVVTCPWHGSQFDMETGRVLRGPATFAQPRLALREVDGVVEAKLEHPIP